MEQACIASSLSYLKSGASIQDRIQFETGHGWNQCTRKGNTMSIQEANYWNGEISDAEINREADAGYAQLITSQETWVSLSISEFERDE